MTNDVSTYHAEHQGDVRVSEASDHLRGHGQDEIASNRHLRTTFAKLV
jgi:hypothetical protein